MSPLKEKGALQHAPLLSNLAPTKYRSRAKVASSP